MLIKQSCTLFVKPLLPFRYLGIKISPKKLSVADCAILADKITARLRTWGTRALLCRENTAY